MKAIVDRLARAIIPSQIRGALRHRQHSEVGRAWGGPPFNGQGKRCLLFASLVGTLDPVAIVETGTYLGTTTEWLSAFQVPVFTIERDPAKYGYSKSRLALLSNVHVSLSDSRSGLKRVIAEALPEHRNTCAIFYLDAHWGADLPLVEEIDVIFGAMPNAVVMIDDFEVPWDSGYGFDNYGLGKSLNFSYIDNIAKTFKLRLFYPSTPSGDETGAKRGCVVLCGSDPIYAKLLKIYLLRKYDEDRSAVHSR
jgi:hypothetical protein